RNAGKRGQQNPGNHGHRIIRFKLRIPPVAFGPFVELDCLKQSSFKRHFLTENVVAPLGMVESRISPKLVRLLIRLGALLDLTA
ncbi:MAG TPA: hypothetical protein VJ719_13690, partial [Chthoniobacterales bacterium]|nr:hypothetical protein [Chthoniobacterales bacterium]